MKLYHFPSPNPQKVTFALKELGLDCEIVPVDLAKGEQRQPDFLALNPFGRVPVLTDGDLTITESHAILAYLGEKTGRLWPSTRRRAPFCSYSRPIARLPSNSTRCAKARVSTVRLGRFMAGRRYPTAALQRRILRTVS
jgi:glutathione S-transferase